MNEQKKHRLLAGANAAVVVLAAVAIVAMLNFLSVRHYRRWNWSNRETSTLSPKTVQVLKGLKEPVTAYLLLADGEAGPELRAQISDLLDSYRGYSDKLTVKTLDPERDPVEIQRLEIKNAHSVVFERTVGGRPVRQTVNAATLAELDETAGFYGGPQTLKAFKGEEAFTNALASFGEEKRTVCFASGHGERPPDDRDPEGIGQLKEYLERENYATRAQPVGGAAAVPADCAVLLIAGPALPFQPAESARLADYLKQGGRLLLLAEPAVARDRKSVAETGLEELLRARGLELRRDLAIDARAAADRSGQLFYAAPAPGHAISQPLARARPPERGFAVVPLSRSLGLPPPPPAGSAPAAGAPPAWSPLLTTSPEAFGVTDLSRLAAPGLAKSDRDTPGPLTLAAALGDAKDDRAERIVVFGSARFASNQLAETANPVYLVNAVHWLARREARIAIPPRKIGSETLTVTRRQVWLAFLWLVVLAPGLTAAAGLWMWIERRRG